MNAAFLSLFDYAALSGGTAFLSLFGYAALSGATSSTHYLIK